jgi:N-dimethylarginine dimethylaminohydrolase
MFVNSQSMVDPLYLCLLKSPRQAHRCQEEIDAQWENLHYLGRPNYAQVLVEYDGFINLLSRHGMELLYLPAHDGTGLDSVYTHDPLVVTSRGAILGNMGKVHRTGEPAAAATFLAQHGIPILGEICSPGTLEGGDVCWLDARTVAVGEGYRTNAAGIRQLRALLGDLVDEVIPVPLPHWTGPDDCLHLLSFISPVDHDKAVVYSRMMPVPFRRLLLARGMTLIEVPDAEYDTMACNVLAVAPGKCIMLTGNPLTQARLEAAGLQVWTFLGGDLCIKGGGGPTCLTRPLVRQV